MIFSLGSLSRTDYIMKVLVALCAIAACAVAKPFAGFAYSALSPLVNPYAYAGPYASPYAYPAAPLAPVVPVGVKNQYFAQDFAGQVSYGFSEPSQAQSVVQDAAGNKVGSFSYVNPDGKLVQTNYVADALGYRVASNDLPAAPLVQPVPVQDTPEVAEAKAKFLAEFEQAKSRARRSVPVQTPASTTLLTAPVAAPVVPAPIAYSAAAPIAYSAAAPLAYSAAAPFSYAGPYSYTAAPYYRSIYGYPYSSFA